MPVRNTSRGTLEGRSVVVTRPRDRAGQLADLIEERGGTVVLAPAIELVPAPAHALGEAARAAVDGEFEWVVFTSPAGAEALLARMPARSGKVRTIRARVAAVGEGTARTLRALGVEPELVPGTFTTHALGRALPRGTGRVLLARADIALSELEAEVTAKGWTAVRVDAYKTRPARRLPAEARWVLRERSADAVTFTSASTVDGFLRLAGGESLAGEPRPRIVCIGPVTARAVTMAGLKVDGVARPHTIEGLVDALERALPPRASGKESR